MAELTPWEDINPPMASAQRREQPCASLEPATSVQFRDELTACLALVAPVGMTEEARAEWLAVAWETLRHLPADMLRHGARKARERCDHPSKIVPTILAETSDWMASRRKVAADARGERPAGLIEDRSQYCSPEEAAKIMEEFGLRSRFTSARDDE